jgi:AmiR/NasT family two-component response regulator
LATTADLRHQVDVEQAFAILRSTARNRNQRLSDLAQALVDGTERL